MHNTLNISKAAYELLVLDNYFRWCELNAYNEEHLQNLLTSPAVSKWWRDQYAHLERDFMELYELYKTVTTKEQVHSLYNEETQRISTYYPKPLINAIRPKYASRVAQSKAKTAGHHLN